MLERYLTFKAAARQSREFVPRIAEHLRTAQLDEALKVSQSYRRSHLAMVVSSGLQALAAVPEQAPGQAPGKAMTQAPERQMRLQTRKAKRALRRATALKMAELQRGMSALATVGSTAPFVGLFGTVIGIINSFQMMRMAEGQGFSAIAGALA